MSTSGRVTLRQRDRSWIPLVATTVALAVLTSAGTAILIKLGTTDPAQQTSRTRNSAGAPVAKPGEVLAPGGPIVVDRVVGTFGIPAPQVRVEHTSDVVSLPPDSLPTPSPIPLPPTDAGLPTPTATPSTAPIDIPATPTPPAPPTKPPLPIPPIPTITVPLPPGIPFPTGTPLAPGR